MFNRIRHAIRRTRKRHTPRARHRKALTPTRPTLIYPKPSDELTLFLRQLGDRADFLPDEETALVRPYVLASEQFTRQSSVPVPHLLLAHTCFAPVEVHG
ncbi:hypothetical protein [Streptomyces wedmorensis]|uniref:hypothetical protein n=1 Tax=Streptomyces wedmorensis TaxID=43759 RepID=UPI0037BB51F7